MQRVSCAWLIHIQAQKHKRQWPTFAVQDLHPGNILVRERSLKGDSWLAWMTQQLVQLPPKVVFLGECCEFIHSIVVSGCAKNQLITAVLINHYFYILALSQTQA